MTNDALAVHKVTFMRIFVYEYTCAGDVTSDPTAQSLQTEGWAILSALLEDFGRLPATETITMLDSRIPLLWKNRACSLGAVCREVHKGEEVSVFQALAQTADFTLVIAPEFDNLLLMRCQWVEEVRSRLLGPSSGAVALTADKLALGLHLRDRRIPTPESRLFIPGKAPTDLTWPLVWKPRNGAGSQATFLMRDQDELQACARQAEGWEGEFIVQPFVAGLPASVSFLVGPQTQIALLPGEQILSLDGRFHYRGGRLPLPAPLAERAVRLAGRAVDSVAELRGYIGVDLVLGSAADGSLDWVMEINPRLTTSYVGLRALAQTNLAEAMVGIVQGNDIPKIIWRSGQVAFQASGKVELIESVPQTQL
jgi:predicted ATP-grasp superfamily ATP-dependent carboligase